MRRKARHVQIGQRYREAGTDAFGRPRRRVWRIENTYTGVDGLIYATLADKAEGSRKTIAISVLLDRSFYLPVDDQ